MNEKIDKKWELIKTIKNYWITLLSLIFFVILAIIIFSITVSAESLFDSMKNGMSDILNSSLSVAGYTLATFLIFAVAISMTIIRVNVFATIMAISLVLAFCVVVNWIDFWILLLYAMLIVIWFSLHVSTKISGQGGE